MTSTRTIWVVGVGMGPQHVTPEASASLRSAAYVIAAEKGPDDPLLAVRRQVAAMHGLEVVAVADPPRDRDDPADYDGAVRDWHALRAAAYAAVIEERDGDPAFLVWGDPSLYDSTIRVADLIGGEVRVVAGISAPQLLAARHRIVLHEVGRPVLVTTGRRLREAIDAGHSNVVVMLSGALALEGLDDWTIWWGANLGAPSERLVAGRVGDVLARLLAEREAAKADAGWVMDVYRLRGPR